MNEEEILQLYSNHDSLLLHIESDSDGETFQHTPTGEYWFVHFFQGKYQAFKVQKVTRTVTVWEAVA